MRYLLMLPLLAVLPARAAAADIRPVAPFIDQQTVAVAYIDVDRIDLASLVGALEKIDPKDLAEFKKESQRQLRKLKEGGGRAVYILFSVATLPEGSPVIVIPVAEGKDAKKLAAALGKEEGLALQFEARSGVVIGAERSTLRRLRDFKPAARRDLTQALAAGNSVVQLAFSPGAVLRRAVEETLPKLPSALGGTPITVFTHGVQWLAVGLSPPPRAEVRLTVQAANADSARTLQEVVGTLIKAAGTSKEVRESLPDFDKLARTLKPEVKGDRLTLVAREDLLSKVILPLVRGAHLSAVHTRDAINLKELGLAMHNYADGHKHLPAAATTDKQNRRLLSWRVEVLPYIGEQKLYKEFHHDEPWDSEHNKKLIKRMPKVFISATNPRLAADSKTTYLAPVGLATIFPGTRPVRFPGDITDGTSNTILLVDADDKHAVVWTKPEDLNLDPANPAKGLRLHRGKTFLVLMADVSAHALPANISKTTLNAAFTRSGGEVLGSDFR